MIDCFEDWLGSDFTVGNRIINGRLALAPMSKLGHVAFRELAAGYGGYGLLFTEMCGARSLPSANSRVSSCFRWRDRELDHLVCQIYGSDPREMALAAQRVELEGFFGVDMNMGCSVSGICKHGCGAALLRNPDRAVAVIREVRKAVSLPVFIKYRTGWEDNVVFAIDMARRFEDAGADCLTFHPRVAPDRRSRPPKWEYIARIKEAVSIPVLGNGNVFTLEDCRTMVEQTGCDGVALGRMAIARPWIFAEWTGRFKPDPDLFRQAALTLVDLLEIHFGPDMGFRYFKKYSQYLAANFIYGHTIWPKLWQGESLDAVRENIEACLNPCPLLSSRPSLYMFTT
jgi:nifR3 family TIM-barrel protein